MLQSVGIASNLRNGLGREQTVGKNRSMPLEKSERWFARGRPSSNPDRR